MRKKTGAFSGLPVIVKNRLISRLSGTSGRAGGALRSKNKGGSLPGKIDPVFWGKWQGSDTIMLRECPERHLKGGCMDFKGFLPSLNAGFTAGVAPGFSGESVLLGASPLPHGHPPVAMMPPYG